MGRLFWKIFIGYWIAAVVLVVLAAWTTHQVANLSRDSGAAHPSDTRGTHRVALRARLRMHSVAERLGAGDEKGARELLEHRGQHLLAVDADGAELLGRKLPAPVRALLSGGNYALRPGERWLTEHVAGPDGSRYTLLMRSPLPGDDRVGSSLRPGTEGRAHKHFRARRGRLPTTLGRLMGPPRFRDFWWVRLSIALLVSGLVCYLLARYLTGPVRRLRQATRRVSAGDLGVRVSDTLGRRRDEIVDLAHDFDAMTAQLEALVSSQQRLLRDVAHELRSPLARLHVALELARQRSDGRADAEHNRIELETERLSELIGQILELEQLNQPITAAQAERVDLAQVVREVVEDASFESQANDVTLQCHIEAEPWVYGQANQLRSAVENVVRNACKYSPQGSSVTVSLVWTQREEAIVIRVRDSGPGVPAEALAHLFDPFYRVDSARSREHGGHGLGLAIANRIARRHHGRIEAENVAIGTGLEVSIHLPTQRFQ